jgi:hypothetical protein
MNHLAVPDRPVIPRHDSLLLGGAVTVEVALRTEHSQVLNGIVVWIAIYMVNRNRGTHGGTVLTDIESAPRMFQHAPRFICSWMHPDWVVLYSTSTETLEHGPLDLALATGLVQSALWLSILGRQRESFLMTIASVYRCEGEAIILTRTPWRALVI